MLIGRRTDLVDLVHIGCVLLHDEGGQQHSGFLGVNIQCTDTFLQGVGESFGAFGVLRYFGDDTTRRLGRTMGVDRVREKC